MKNPVLARRSPGSAWLFALAFAAAALVAAGAVVLWSRNSDGIVESASLIDAACNLQEAPCRSAFDDGRAIEVSFSPLPVKPAAPFEIVVDTGDVRAHAVKVDLAGEGMDMGFNRPELTSSTGHRYEGRATLSVCTLDRMYWRATILIYTEEGILAAPFRFETLQ